HVVELPDTGEPCEDHLGVDSPGKTQVRVRVQPLSDRVHTLTPRPESAAIRMRAAAQRAMKSVRVGIGEPGQRETSQNGALTRRTRLYRDDARAVDGDRNPGSRPVRQPRVLTPEPHPASSSSTAASARTPAAQSSSVANSSEIGR